MPLTTTAQVPPPHQPYFYSSSGQLPSSQGESPAPAPQAAPLSAKVALLVPLSGPSAALGQAMANAAQLAVFDMGESRVELMPRDTKGTKAGAEKAARDALAAGANMLIGPLFAADVAAVKPIAASARVPMLALSTDMALGAPGAYIMGFAPTAQVERVVDYALKAGVRRFAAIVPSGPYGQLAAKAFRASVERGGGLIVAIEVGDKIEAIVVAKGQFDALFLPQAGESLDRLGVRLTEAGVLTPGVRLLGTGLWDEGEIGSQHPFLVGGWFAAPEATLRERFVKGYQEAYASAPPRLATLAYDATAMAVVLARRGMGYDAESLTLPTGFAGVDGLFRLTPMGPIERGLAVNEVGTGGNRVIDPSPDRFGR